MYIQRKKTNLPNSLCKYENNQQVNEKGKFAREKVQRVLNLFILHIVWRISLATRQETTHSHRLGPEIEPRWQEVDTEVNVRHVYYKKNKNKSDNSCCVGQRRETGAWYPALSLHWLSGDIKRGCKGRAVRSLAALSSPSAPLSAAITRKLIRRTGWNTPFQIRNRSLARYVSSLDLPRPLRWYSSRWLRGQKSHERKCWMRRWIRFEGLERTLFVRTKHNMWIFGVIYPICPFVWAIFFSSWKNVGMTII